MKATWSMQKGLEVVGQANRGQPRIWIVDAWARVGSQKMRVLLRPKGKCHLSDLVEMINKSLLELEEETNLPADDAGFLAIAR